MKYAHAVPWCDIFWSSLFYIHSLKFKSILLITVFSRNDGACCLAIIFGAVILVTLHSFQWRNNGRDGVSNHQPHHCLLNRLFRRRSKKISKLCITGLCAGNSPVTGEFPAQMASNAENVSIWWHHHIVCSDVCNPFEGRESVNGIYGWLSSNELSVTAAMATCHIRFQWAIIGSDNGMWIVWRQAITWITDDLL